MNEMPEVSYSTRTASMYDTTLEGIVGQVAFGGAARKHNPGDDENGRWTQDCEGVRGGPEH